MTTVTKIVSFLVAHCYHTQTVLILLDEMENVYHDVPLHCSVGWLSRDKVLLTFVVVVTRPLRRDECMAEDHEAPEPRKLSKTWTRDRKVTESRQRTNTARNP